MARQTKQNETSTQQRVSSTNMFGIHFVRIETLGLTGKLIWLFWSLILLELNGWLFIKSYKGIYNIFVRKVNKEPQIEVAFAKICHIISKLSCAFWRYIFSFISFRRMYWSCSPLTTLILSVTWASQCCLNPVMLLWAERKRRILPGLCSCSTWRMENWTERR